MICIDFGAACEYAYFFTAVTAVEFETTSTPIVSRATYCDTT